jgi:hypothetical protein
VGCSGAGQRGFGHIHPDRFGAGIREYGGERPLSATEIESPVAGAYFALQEVPSGR